MSRPSNPNRSPLLKSDCCVLHTDEYVQQDSFTHVSVDVKYIPLDRFYSCWYCGQRLINLRSFYLSSAHPQSRGESWWIEAPEGYERLQRDHRTPKRRGGTDNADNLSPACVRCNSQKGERTVEEYRQWLRTMRAGEVIFHGEAVCR